MGKKTSEGRWGGANTRWKNNRKVLLGGKGRGCLHAPPAFKAHPIVGRESEGGGESISNKSYRGENKDVSALGAWSIKEGFFRTNTPSREDRPGKIENTNSELTKTGKGKRYARPSVRPYNLGDDLKGFTTIVSGIKNALLMGDQPRGIEVEISGGSREKVCDVESGRGGSTDEGQRDFY